MKCQDFKNLIPQIQNGSDGSLSPLELQQWEAHLLTCPACLDYYQQANEEQLLSADESETLMDSVLLATSQSQEALNSLFQQMQTHEAPPEFTKTVLAKTASMQKRKRQRYRFQQACKSLLLRPRFAQEISFVVTMCWVLVFGMPNEEMLSTDEFQQWLEQVTETLKPNG